MLLPVSGPLSWAGVQQVGPAGSVCGGAGRGGLFAPLHIPADQDSQESTALSRRTTLAR